MAAVVSPHLDDAVLSCGYLLARSPGATVVTVFAGLPWPEPALTPWDADCGFSSTPEAMAGRRQEDVEAMQTLGTIPQHLPFPDAQYGHPCCDREIAEALQRALAHCGTGTVAIPLGLFHQDHKQASRAAVVACCQRASETIVYADVPYRSLGDNYTQARLSELASWGRLDGPVDLGPRDRTEADHKRRALRCYPSQAQGLAQTGRLGVGDAFAPETYWRVTWEPMSPSS